jgi:ectoine hydroxylase-related dioxygenase (phytanoyl-CoA dioxygenase family)
MKNQDKKVLSQEQLDSFRRNGYLVIEGVLGDSDLQPLEQEYAALLDEEARRLHERGRIDSTYAEYDFAGRFARIVAQDPECIDRMNISLPLVNGEIDAERYQAHTGPAVFELLRNPKVLDVVEAVIGPEIASSPVQQMRIKPPLAQLVHENVAHSGVGNTTWHQDTVAVLDEADDTEQLTVWIAVTDADEENGCLVSIAGSHLEGAHRHVPGDIPREPTVPADIIAGREGEALPVGRGGVIIFHKQNIHCSKPNRSNRLRWSLDLRYHPVGQASGRPAFPGFVARSRAKPESELRDPALWNQMWQDARMRIIRSEYQGPIFKDWNAPE